MGRSTETEDTLEGYCNNPGEYYAWWEARNSDVQKGIQMKDAKLLEFTKPGN